MFQTGYKGYTTLAKGLPYYGGFCKWYYITKEQLLNFPPVDPATQYMTAEPAINGSWCGPVQVPRDQMGFEEVLKRDKAGIYYQIKVSGFQPGDDRINLENMPYHEFAVVGKMRAGGVHLIIGNRFYGLTFDADFKSAGNESAGSSFLFSGEFLNKALVLPSFQGSNIILPPVGNTGGTGSTGSAGSGANPLPEIITYSSGDPVQVAYTPALKDRFGPFPTIEVWYTEDGVPKLNTAPSITVDSLPPDTSLFTIIPNAPAPGIIILK